MCVVDVHHGNGTEEILRAIGRPNEMFFYSVHLYDKESTEAEASAPTYSFYPGSGLDDDTISNVVNSPIQPIWRRSPTPTPSSSSPQGTSSPKATDAASMSARDEWRLCVSQRLIPTLRAFSPDLIFISAGFDARKDDIGNTKLGTAPLQGGMDLEPDDFFWITERICTVGRTVRFCAC